MTPNNWKGEFVKDEIEKGMKTVLFKKKHLNVKF